MLNILPITVGLFSLMGLGYALVRLNIFSMGQMRGLGRFVITIALPALIFLALARSSVRDVFDPAYLLAYLCASLIGFGAALLAAKLVKADGLSAVFMAMGSGCANSSFVGLPLLLVALPSVAPQALAMNMVVENIIILPMVIVAAEIAKGGAQRDSLLKTIALRLVSSPILWAMLLGLLVAQMPWDLPQIIERPLGYLAQTSTALSLIFIGATLSTIALKGMADLRIWVIVGLKLLVMPLTIWLSFKALGGLGVLPYDPALVVAGLLMAAAPQMGIYPIMAAQYGQERMAALAMLISTIGSFFTLSALLYLI